MNYRYFTSESVCAGHPDKICDQISDSILDACLAQDKNSRVAVETLVTTNKVVLAGEVTTKAKVNFENIARLTIKNLGYDSDIYQFNYKNADIEVYIHHQSPDIARGVEKLGAGDQGMMFGYACRETSELMPLPITLAHGLTRRIDQARGGELKYLRPDGKAQVTVEYENGIPKRITRVICAVPHDPKTSASKVAKDIYKTVINPCLAKFGFSIDFSSVVVNGTGKWEIGGPSQDTGVTGRKIIVDTYGGFARIGGGCFSGKDPTKVDRSAAYAARYIAKNVVAARLADRCEIQLAYVIGKPRPVAKSIETFATQRVPFAKIEKFAWGLIDLSVAAIIDSLKLRQPMYKKTAAYGHFGNTAFPWEKLQKAYNLKFSPKTARITPQVTLL